MKPLVQAIVIVATVVPFGLGVYVLYDALFGEGRRLGMTARGLRVALLNFIVAGLNLLGFLTFLVR